MVRLRRKPTRIERLGITLGVAGLVLGLVGIALAEWPRDTSLARLAVEPNQLNLRLGDEVPLVVSGQLSDGRAAPDATLGRARWVSSAPSVAGYERDHVVTRTTGRTVLTARLGKLWALVIVEVGDPAGDPLRGSLLTSPSTTIASTIAPFPTRPAGTSTTFGNGRPLSATIIRGAAVLAPSCVSASCRRVHVILGGGANVEHTVSCHDAEGAWYVYRTSSRQSATCFYGFAGREVWVVVDGKVESNHITW